MWQPLQFATDGEMSLPEFHESWRIDTRTGRLLPDKLTGKRIDLQDRNRVRRSCEWRPHTDPKGFTDLRSDQKDACLTIPFTGSQIAIYSVARSGGGFRRVQIKGSRGTVVLTTIIETYCLYREASLKFLSPKLKPGDFTLTLTVLGEHFFWQAKHTTFGSTGNFVSVQNSFWSDKHSHHVQ